MKTRLLTLLGMTAGVAFAQADLSVGAKAGGNYVEIVSIDKLPIAPPPSELEKIRRMASAPKADDGFSTQAADPAVVRQFLSNVDLVTAQTSGKPAQQLMQGERPGQRAPVIFKNIEDVKLSFAPSAMNGGELIGVSPSGTMVGNAWTGVERFYRIPNAGTMRLAESDLAAAGGKVFLLKETVNSHVAGRPAVSVVFVDSSGQKVEQVHWVNEHKLYVLTFAPTMEQGRFGLAKVNSRISANSLAQSLR